MVNTEGQIKDFEGWGGSSFLNLFNRYMDFVVILNKTAVEQSPTYN